MCLKLRGRVRVRVSYSVYIVLLIVQVILWEPASLH